MVVSERQQCWWLFSLQGNDGGCGRSFYTSSNKLGHGYRAPFLRSFVFTVPIPGLVVGTHNKAYIAHTLINSVPLEGE